MTYFFNLKEASLFIQIDPFFFLEFGFYIGVYFEMMGLIVFRTLSQHEIMSHLPKICVQLIKQKSFFILLKFTA